MKKFRLQLDDLLIDSFSTTTVRREKGTVFGEQCTCPTACSCPGCPTCDESCNGGCGPPCSVSCNGPCDYSCGGTCDYYCGGTVNDATCNNYGTCHYNG